MTDVPKGAIPMPVADVADWGDRKVAGSLADLSAEEMESVRADSKKKAAARKKRGEPSMSPGTADGHRPS